MSSFQNRFKALRSLHGLSADSYDSVLGISRRMIFAYQAQKANPTLEKLLALANYFCCSLDYLTGRTDDPRWMDYIPKAEEDFYHHPDTWPELIEMYQRDKAANPIHLAPVFLRACETIRNEHIREKHEDEKK